MRTIDLRDSSSDVDLRGSKDEENRLSTNIRKIIDNVRLSGDKALIDLTNKFDGVLIDKLRVTDEEVGDALKNLKPELRAALNRSIKNQRKFQKSLLDRNIKKVKIQDGITVWREWRPIQRVGLYVPGGLAAYPSTVIMNVVPAQVAGCGEIAIATPVSKSGRVNATVLATAAILGVTEIYKVGGAQAIAALAYGTGTIKKVDKIFGPGNQFVTSAKQLISGSVAIDMPAGPSEICVIADASANPKWVAADLLAQCEHDTQAQAVIISESPQLLRDVEVEVRSQLQNLPTRATAEKSFDTTAVFVLVKDINQAVQAANNYAPEHLELQTSNNDQLLPSIRNAGSVFVGAYSAEALGDYSTGSNHVLPTSGFARSFSGLSVDSFGKWIEFQKVTYSGLNSIGQSVVDLAQAENLVAHAKAVTIRLTDM